MHRQLLFAVSVAIALSISKPAAAETDAPSPWENFNLGGYSSAGINVHPGGKTDGALNEVSLILSWENSSRFRFFSELGLERPLTFHEDDTVVGKDFYFNLERLYVDYNLSEKLNLRAGRFLNPTGRWNLVHAAPLVWTSSRPLATSRLFPLSTNGLMFYGAVPLANNAFEYSFFVEGLKDQIVNKGEIPYEDIKGARFTLSGKVNWGLSLLEFREDIPGNPRFRMLGLDFLVQNKGWEFSGEAFQRYYSNYSDGGSGAYLQGVAPLGKKWFAVARVENFKRPAEGSSERWLLGTAWRMAPNRVLKIEYVGGDEERPESPKGLLASFAILF
ncbi:MAG: hypothetical protein ACXWTR_02110 [Methylotenera sp.]